MMFGLTIKAAAVAVGLSSVAASAATVTAGPGGFDDGYATTITYDDAAPRGTDNDRADPTNALGSTLGDFFEIGYGSSADLTFGTLFRGTARIVEITFGSALSFPESVSVFAGLNGVFTAQGTLANAGAEGPDGATVVLVGGPFDTLRFIDTSIAGAPNGGFDIDTVQVSPVPLPAGGLLLVTALAGLGFMRRRKAA